MSTLERTWAGLLLLTLLIAVGCGSASELDGGRVPASGGSAGFISAGFPGVLGGAGQATAGRGGSAGGGAGGTLGSAGAAGSTPTAPLVSIALTPPVASVAVGTQVALRATATYADKSTRDVTASAVWASSGPEVKVSTGLVSGVSPG